MSIKRKRLGQSGLSVSELGFGCMTFGSQVDEATSHRFLDVAFEAGITFFDTAEMYSSPSRAETYGRSEEILGTWLRTKPRDAAIVATKLVGRMDGAVGPRLPYIRGGHTALDRHHFVAAVEASLRRLQREWIDLYQSHWPDRETPLDEQLEAIDLLVRSGKIRYYGVSNETPWGLTRLCTLGEQHSLPRPVAIQNAYSLVQRVFETGLAEVCREEGVGLIAFSPLAMGVLTGKYSKGQRPSGARLEQFVRYAGMYLQDRLIGIADKYIAAARRFGIDPIEMAYAWVRLQPEVACVLTSCTRIEQLTPYLRSAELVLPPELVQELDLIRSDHDARWNQFG